jgi:GR25 family glycosyltransferase involved in LPS biosynthesis
MDCLYINLARETKRRENLEKNFDLFKKQGWDLSRIEATSADDVRDRDVMGRLTPNEKACCLSHIEAVKASIAVGGHVMILEDDAEFGPHSCAIIDQIISSLPSDGWDVLFTDIGPGNEHYMIELLQLRRRLIRENQFKVLSLKGVFFGAATAYIINEKSKEKVLKGIAANEIFNVPYDLILRNLVFKDELRGFVLFPFATTLSDEALRSQIQQERTKYSDLILTLFRKAVWFDRDLEKCRPYLEVPSPNGDELENRIFGKIFGAMLSENFAKL